MFSQTIKTFFIASLFLFLPQVVNAGFLDTPALSSCISTGDCTFEHVAVGLTELIRMLLGIMGSAALIYFVWGGIQWLISGGNSERVNRGKQIMINTVFAIILAFGSYLIVNFFINDVLQADTPYQIEEGEPETTEEGST